MLTLAVKSKGSLSFESIQSRFDYLVVTYVDNKRIYHREPSLSMIHVTAPKAKLTSIEKLLSVEALFSITNDSKQLEEYWSSL